MKIFSRISVLSFLFLIIAQYMSADKLNQTLLFDFGTSDVTNGDVTVNPDANNHYWNNIATAAGGNTFSSATSPFKSLVNTSGLETNYVLTFISGSFATNGKLNGGLLTPDPLKFGVNSDLAIMTATEDYIFTGSTTNGSTFKISGLDKDKLYVFKIFGSRSGSITKTSQYSIQGDGDVVVGSINTSTSAGANLSDVYVSNAVKPNSKGEISISIISLVSGSYAYMNCMQIVEYNREKK